MVRLTDKETGVQIGTITEEQLDFLMDQLEEDSVDDHDYYINRPTLESFEEMGADPELLEVLKDALAGREEMEIQWTRQ